MSYKSLRDFIERLERDGRLVRVTQPVSTNLEMTEIQTRVLAEGGPALLFENAVRPDGTAYDMPVLTNLFGTVERVAWGMDREPAQLREVGETLAFLRQPEPPGGFREALSHLPLLKTVMAMKPKTVSSAPCQEVVLTGNEIDLSALPIQSCWPGEPAPLITWPLVVTQGPNPDGNKADAFNLGIYRMQVTGSDTTLMRWLKHRGGAQHYARWKNEKPEPLPAAVVIGAVKAAGLTVGVLAIRGVHGGTGTGKALLRGGGVRGVGIGPAQQSQNDFGGADPVLARSNRRGQSYRMIQRAL